MVLMLLWESEDITISSLNKGTVNFRNELHGFVGISLLSVLYSIGMAALGISGLHIPSFLASYSHSLFKIIMILYFLASTACWSDVGNVGAWCTNNECQCNSVGQQFFCKEPRLGYIVPTDCYSE